MARRRTLYEKDKDNNLWLNPTNRDLPIKMLTVNKKPLLNICLNVEPWLATRPGCDRRNNVHYTRKRRRIGLKGLRLNLFWVLMFFRQYYLQSFSFLTQFLSWTRFKELQFCVKMSHSIALHLQGVRQRGRLPLFFLQGTTGFVKIQSTSAYEYTYIEYHVPNQV